MPESKIDIQRYGVWKSLQDVEYNSYINNDIGVFSTDDSIEARQFGEFLRDNVKGECLDVGCGLLPEPAYMKNQQNIRFTGIDPFGDPIAREFDFIQGVGEAIPFDDETFDAVIFASTIDHMIDPQLALKESYRVLEDDGILAIWYSERAVPVLKFGYIYNKHHQWGFTEKVLIDYVRNAGYEKPIVSQIIKSVGNERILWVYK